MLNFEQSRAIAQKFVQELDSPEHLVLSNWFEKSQICYAFAYNTKDCIEKGDMLAAIVGHGPLIVDRRDGRVIETGSGVNRATYFENYEKRGDPYKEVGAEVEISNETQDKNRISAILAVKEFTSLGLKDAKIIFEKVIGGETVTVTARTIEFADTLETSLRSFGYSIKRP